MSAQCQHREENANRAIPRLATDYFAGLMGWFYPTIDAEWRSVGGAP